MKEMEADEAALHEASAEIQSLRRKMIRVESEQPQDYVRETRAISYAEAEEMGFVPSALGEPRGAIYWCDHRRSEKAIRSWEMASMVIEERGGARRFNLCQQCSHGKLMQQSKQPLKLWQWKFVVEKKAHRERLLSASLPATLHGTSSLCEGRHCVVIFFNSLKRLSFSLSYSLTARNGLKVLLSLCHLFVVQSFAFSFRLSKVRSLM